MTTQYSIMKKIISVLFFISIVIGSANAMNCITAPAPVNTIPIGHGVSVSYEQLVTLTPKQYRELTGHRLGLFKSVALKAVQKKIKKTPYYSADGKSQVTAAILAVLLGGLGIHRFYLGYTWQGIVQLLTLGGLGIWCLVDTIRIFTGDLKPKNGDYGQTF